MAQIYDLDQIPTELLPKVGGKARGLYELIQGGFDVPQAFIVTDIQPDDSLDEVVAKYHELNMNSVSVRSSATLEDGNDYSAAGQFSTFLQISGDEPLRQAVRDCVASLHNHTAAHYAKNFLQSDLQDHGHACSMTVIVQSMVDARCAGVIFTQAPMYAGYTLIEAVPGLGENLVSGKMSAQQYRVRNNHIMAMPENALLSYLEVIAIGSEARRCQSHFGKPMDLEYAINHQGQLLWLQARPITIEESVTVNELDCRLAACQSTITTSNIGEVMPGAVTPLNLSTNMYALDWGVMETYREIGAIPRPAEPYTYISSYYNHMFFNMTNMYQVCHATFSTSKDTMDIAIAGHVLDGPDNPMPNAPFFKRLRNTMRFMHIVFAGDEAKKGMDEVIAKLHFDLTQDMHGLYQQILDHFDELKWVQYYHYRTSYYSGGQSNFLLMALKNRFKDPKELQSLIAGCLTQIENFESANVLKKMRELASTMLQEQPQVAQMDAHALSYYFQHEMSPRVAEVYQQFMEQHGHRGIREMEVRSKSWRDNPDSFAMSMHSVLSTTQSSETAHRAWTDYKQQLLLSVRGPLRAWYERLVDNARKGVQYREYTKAKVIYAVDQYKQAYAQLGQLMAQAGLLPDSDAIYFLLQNEVGELLAGNAALVKKALARRRLLDQQMNLRFPNTCIGIPQPLEAQISDPNATQYTGTPVSRGIATGPARIVREEKDAALLQKGDIMVALGTDVGWTPYYDMIGGLVTEIGSALSHGIVVAREYALPAVVNVANALNNIHDGDILTIDGNTGTIFINSRV